MRIKKFTGESLKAATEVMKEELGAEAIILNTRKVSKGGLLNFLSKEEYEITAAVDEQAPQAKFAAALAQAGAQSGQENENHAFAGLQKVADQFGHRMKEKNPPAARQDAADLQQLRSEIESLKSIVGEVAEHLKYSKMPSLPEQLKVAYAALVNHDVDEKLAAELTQRVYRKLGEDLLGSRQHVEQCLLKEMSGLFQPLSPSDSPAKKAKIIALVGPTGVGKTTTIAKLAAIAKLVKKQNVALISADTYRIGAIEQLRTFAAIADIPMEVVYKPTDMKSALVSLRDKDIIYIDTVGRSQRMKKEMTELAKFISAANPQEVHLVLSAATSSRSCDDVIEKFRVTTPNRIVFSKLDEAVTLGSLLNVIYKHTLPVSFVTNGQNVPDDIEEANANKLASMIYSGELQHA
ncbi:MAG: flagellar biosynthesis protein FlhF [Ignavibacteriae bacterium]|nr:flagellar biosynthesis protein FlhF [Ignavibacteriota bacterium]